MNASSKSTKAQLLAQLAAANAANAALEARLVIARTSFRAQRDTIAELEAKLNTRGCIASATDDASYEEAEAAYACDMSIAEYRAKLATRIVKRNNTRSADKPVISRFTKRDGSTWERTRTGNTSILRELLVIPA